MQRNASLISKKARHHKHNTAPGTSGSKYSRESLSTGSNGGSLDVVNNVGFFDSVKKFLTRGKYSPSPSPTAQPNRSRAHSEKNSMKLPKTAIFFSKNK